MDNIIQIIVFFFIIYAILSPIINKKKTQGQNRTNPNMRNGEGRPDPSPRSSSQDILEEMFGFKIPKTPDQMQKPVPSQVGQSEYAQIPTVDYDTDLKVNYRNLETTTKMPDIDFDKLSTQEIEKLETAAEQKPSSIYNIVSPKSKKLKNLKNMMKDNKSLRNLFLVSEVINKPKALRR